MLTEEPQEGRAQEPAAAAVPGAEIGSGPQSRDHQREAVSAPEKSQADPKRSAGSSADERDLIERLEAEWPALASGPLLGRLRIWSEREPVLASFATPQQLLRQLRGLRGHHRAEDEILAALLRQAQTDPLAARVVLQALLPGLKALARRILLEASERDELWSALLAHCWERIRSYPLERRPARIAANTLFDTLKKTTYELRRNRRDRDQYTHEPPTEQAALKPADSDVQRLVQRAIAAAAISEEEAELILRTRIDGADLHALADEVGLAYHTVKVRRLRAEKRLLLFLGHSPVTFRGRKRPLSSARVVGDGLTGSAGRGAATDLNRRR
ncbi:MAG: sigma-70 RNA polymerase sigma factor region 4 domain-containing protein [Solirubrobacteraceae bacterium]